MIHDLDEFKNIPVDYDSPINIVVNQMADEIARFTENGVIQAVVKAGFDIDKDKLVSILQQDRERYQEAYRKGYKAREDEILHCRDCINRGKSEKCVLAAISEEKDYPLFMLDNRGEWFCADGERKEGR